MKNKMLILATAIGIVLVIGSVVATLVISPLLTAGANSNTAANGNATNGSSASGAIVIAWNKELLHIVLTPGAQPATVHPTRSFAILHAAIYDAVVSITRDAPAYLFSVPASSNARADVAAAQAGHDSLVALYPKWKAALDQQLVSELATIPDGAGKQQGIQVGQAVAARLIAIRANDGSAATPPPFVPGNQPGNYQLTPPKFVAPVFTNWSNVTPFVLNNAAQFRPGPPPAVTSQAYTQSLNEVKSLGQNTSTTRTPEQTVIAKFWAGPIWNTWNEIADNSALAHHTNLETTARLFAVLNLSFADSVITFYDSKYHYQLWRPITAIRQANTAGNPAIVANPTWTPLVVTALDPDYPAAHAVISADGATVLAAFFGNKDQIRATSDVLPGVVASYTSYSDVATEAGLSRIYAGNHTRIAVDVGYTLGNNVAQFVISDLGV
ncbi:MAG TPA: vanadium-dependent haloperoxidase [Ktedonobacteraceae bacterium]